MGAFKNHKTARVCSRRSSAVNIRLTWVWRYRWGVGGGQNEAERAGAVVAGGSIWVHSHPPFLRWRHVRL